MGDRRALTWPLLVVIALVIVLTATPASATASKTLKGCRLMAAGYDSTSARVVADQLSFKGFVLLHDSKDARFRYLTRLPSTADLSPSRGAQIGARCKELYPKDRTIQEGEWPTS